MKKVLGLFLVGALLAVFLISGEAQGGKAQKLELRSSAFSEGERIPSDFTCEGADMSPPLAWSGVPDNAESLAIIVEDPDAPAKNWTHWLIYDLPATLSQLPTGIISGQEFFAGGSQGLNDFKELGYGGPCPPGGEHRYLFKIYALDAMLQLKAGASKQELLQAMRGHILAEGSLTGQYDRS
ncbi:MAG: YbhB/YbcL family Raf kinase inhibitor-like protein [Candidatus Omnitrophota bacterium]